MKHKLITLATCLISLAIFAMPSADELEKVKPLVQDLMKSDLDAMKAGKKSRADVAKSAMSLYPQAESQAAKLLLARSAFNLYVKAGEYEVAEKALDALLSAVPDYPVQDQAELLDKALYSIPYKAAPNLRARLAAIKDKAQAAGQLKSLLSGFDSLPDGPKRKAVATRIAISYVSLGDWPNAVKYFALSDSPAAAAAEAELKINDEPEASRSYDKAANAWWSIELPKRDSKLALSFRAHAADLYAKALPTLTGLAKVQADRRIKEYESAVEAVNAKSEKSPSVASSVLSAGAAKYTGVKLVGTTAKLANGILSDCSNLSYALIDEEFSPGNASIEAVVEFTMLKTSEFSGILSGLGQKDGFTPFFLSKNEMVAYLSNSGTKWDIANLMPIGVSIKACTPYRCKCEWTGSEYIWSVWRGKWVMVKRIQSKLPVAGGIKLAIGVNRGMNSPLVGTIDLSRCYIKVGGKLWWEGVRGAYKNANK